MIPTFKTFWEVTVKKLKKKSNKMKNDLSMQDLLSGKYYKDKAAKAEQRSVTMKQMKEKAMEKPQLPTK